MILEQNNVGNGFKPFPTNIHRSWTDEFGTLIATLEGRSGGRSVMVIAQLEDAEKMLRALQEISGFKGRILFAVLEHLHTAPLEAILRANTPNIVIALEMNCAGIATRGSGIKLKTAHITSSTGASYLEPGAYKAWTGGQLEQEIQSSLEYPSIAASVASSLKIPCAACDLEHLKGLLERLLV